MYLISRLICILLLLPVWSAAQTTDTLEWTLSLGGNKAGFLKKWQNADGSFTEWYQYNDRGRGDSTRATYRLNAQHFLEYLDAGGVDYYKKPVFEKFRLENGRASWENNSEKGEKQLAQAALYMPLNISAGTSFRQYLQAPDSSLQLLPSGTATLSVLREHQLADGKKLRLVAVSGLYFTPNYSWIDEADELFAIPGSWFAYIRKGFEEVNAELLAIQEEFQDRFYNIQARRLMQPVGQGLLITNARLFDPKTGRIQEKANILIEGGRIKAITKGFATALPGYQHLDAAGKFVMPGLWDMHVHYGDPSDGILHLACGVTNVRDMGNSLDLIDKKEKIDQGISLGPRLQLMSGFIDGAGPYAGPTGELINSVEEGKVSIKKYADLGYRQIKLYSSIRPEWVVPLVAEAKKYDLRVSGHIPAHMLASEAIEAGYDEIQHANMLFLNFYGKELDTRTPARFTTVAQQAAEFDFSSDAFRDFARLLKKKRITLDPTVSIFEGMFIGRAGEASPPYAPIVNQLPLNLQRNLKTGSGLPIPEGMEATYQQSFNNLLRMVKLLHDKGITIVPGTDALPGFMLHRELENYAKAGISNVEVLKLATVTSAVIAGKGADYGRIATGKPADLIIIDGDPTKNMEDIRRVEWIVKADHFFEAKALLSAMSIAYFK